MHFSSALGQLPLLLLVRFFSAVCYTRQRGYDCKIIVRTSQQMKGTISHQGRQTLSSNQISLRKYPIIYACRLSAWGTAAFLDSEGKWPLTFFQN